MAIERLSIKEGLEVGFEQAEDLEDFILELFTSAVHQVRILSTGEYDITPSLPYLASYRYSLLVHENGTASYRAIPTLEESIRVRFSADNDPVQEQGGEFVAIPDDDSLVVITSPLSERSLLLFEAIRYLSEE